MTEFVFTRYLYEKEEVKIALLVSLLNKKEALYWAYELYYSGFKEELTEFIWNIYYQFYASLNPSFETFLHKKLKEDDPKTIAVIINNLMIRPYTEDVFLLNQIEDKSLEFYSLETLLESKEYVKIALAIKKLDDKDIKKTFVTVFNHFTSVLPNKIKTLFLKPLASLDKRMILLSRIMYCYSLMNGLKMGKSLYVIVEPEEIIPYETIIDSPRKILQARLYDIDSMDKLSLFKLKRDNQNIREAYLNNWLYYASHSPIWKKRIELYGKIDYEQKKVIFTEEKEEEFSTLYNYEPDEQSNEVNNKSIREIERNTQSDFCSGIDESLKNMLTSHFCL